ncbi:MAG TPA: ABC transporter substrate-binding protein [Rectinemataceae bacterium]|nr:ABC transporter substrate-binding protein [Rectinemataceae bacterium]
MRSSSARFFGIIAVLLVVISTAPAQETAQARLLRQFRLQSAASFSIDYYEGFKLVTVKTPWPGAKEAFSYLLYDKGGPKPPATIFPDATRIASPVSRVVSFSTSYIPSIVAIGETDSILGLDSASWVYDPGVRARIKAGSAIEVTRNAVPDIEKIIALNPDAIFTYGMGNEWDSHPKLIEAGLPVIIDGEWNESDPLARAEWSVFIAAFYNKEDQAETRFQKVRANYLSLKARAAAAVQASAAAQASGPRVLNNGPFQGTWYVSAGDSFMAHMLADAGASYLWADTRGTGALALTVESVFEKALKADVWINPSLEAKKISDVIALDRRFGDLPVVKTGNVWNDNLRLSEAGGNDYFESAVIRPDEVLADLVAIFHPEILPDHHFVWYRKLSE